LLAPLLIALAVAAPADEAATSSAVPPRAVPSTAVPSTGVPAPMRPAPTHEVSFGAFSPMVPVRDGDAADDDLSFDTVAAIPETRMPRTPAQQRRMLQGPRKRQRNLNHRFLPLPHLSSQPAVGLTLGGSLTYSYRRPGEVFNRIWLLAWTRISTKLVQDHILQGRVRDMLGKREVFQFGAIAQTDPVFPFYGVANHENLSGTDLHSVEHSVNVNNYAGWLTYEHPIWQLNRIGRAVGNLRVYSGVFYNVDVIKAYANSQLERELPGAQGVVRRGIVRGGLTWDSRDNDWSPREGSLIDLTFDAAGPYTGSTSGWGRVHATARNYWPLGRSGFVFAHRVTLDALWGKAPLMALGEFGGLFPMDAYGGAFVGRGFARRRFIGNIKATASAEIRFTPLEFNLGRNKLGLGFEAFVELGLVSQRFADLLKHWYPSGGPGLLLIWNRFVVFRVEAGFSREGGALYLQSEHAF
jgi:hypothetical protein